MTTLSNSPVKVAPHSAESEEYLLSSILIDGPNVLADCMSAGLTSDMFYLAANRLIYERLCQMLGEGKQIDLAVLSQELTMAKELEAVGGLAYLMQVSGNLSTTAQAQYFLEKIVELHRLRVIIRNSTDLVERCYGYTGQGIEQLMSEPLARLLSCAIGGSAKDPTWDELIDEAESEMTSVIKNEGPLEKNLIHFPWVEMDELFGPMQRGQLVIIAARPSIGKSSLARQVTIAIAVAGRWVYYVTLEVKPVRVVLMMAAALSRIGLKHFGREHPKDQADFIGALRSLRSNRIYMTNTDRKVAQVVARAKALKAAGKLDIIVIDYGALLDDIANASQRDKEGIIGQVQKTLKRLATELDVVVVELWQLNRGTERDGNREPRISDLKGSGDLEADADKIILLHRPDENPLTTPPTPQDERKHVSQLPVYFQNISQQKGRDDGVATISMEFERSIAAFREILKDDPHGAPPQQDLGI